MRYGSAFPGNAEHQFGMKQCPMPKKVTHGVSPCLGRHGEDAMRYLMDGMDDMDKMDNMDKATARVAPTASASLRLCESTPEAHCH